VREEPETMKILLGLVLLGVVACLIRLGWFLMLRD
jgi:hypothetical protein